jgi:hypothetical protein
VVNTRRFLSTHPDRATPGLRALVEQLSVILDRAGRVADQARTRVGGEQPASATRAGIDARPARPADREGPVVQTGRVRILRRVAGYAA